jgi:hypothetical protein
MTTTLTSIPAQTIVETNAMVNPSAEVNILGYSVGGPGGLPSGSLSQVTDASGSGSYAVRATFTSADANPGANVDAGGVFFDLDASDKPAGTVWSVQALVKPSRATAMRMSIEWLSSGGAVLATTVGVPVQVGAPGNYVTIKAENSQVPGSARTMRIKFYAANTTGFARWQANDTLTVDAVLVMQTASLTGKTYFDGDKAAAGGFRYAWQGMRGRSVSVKTQDTGGAVTVTPLLTLGYTATRKSGSQVHRVPGAQYDAVTTHSAAGRTGTLKFLFDTSAAAQQAEALIATGLPFRLADDEQPVINMTAVLGDGAITTTLLTDDDTYLWTVEFPYVEQAAS